MLPWIKVNNNKTQRARQNGAWGAPLYKIYPAGSLFGSMQVGGATMGANGLPTTAANKPQYVYPNGPNQMQDPRATGGVGYWQSTTSTATKNYDIAPTLNTDNGKYTGGSLVQPLASVPTENWIMLAIAGVLVWFLFIR
jgi:hypothetical protein